MVDKLPSIEVEDATDEVALADGLVEFLAGSQPGGAQSTGGGWLPSPSVGQPESMLSGHVASKIVCLLLRGLDSVLRAASDLCPTGPPLDGLNALIMPKRDLQVPSMRSLQHRV